MSTKTTYCRATGAWLVAAIVIAASSSFAVNIDLAEKFAWSENVGWINFAPTSTGVTVHAQGGYLTGFVWAENIGWIKLGSSDAGPYENTQADNWGVNLAPSGKLTGFAWSENAGWINFHPTHGQVTINRDDGRFEGYAWSESLGWIHLRSPLVPADPDSYGVRTTASLYAGTLLTVR